MKTGKRIIACSLFFVLLVGGCGDGGRGSGLIGTEAPTELRVPSNGAYGILVVGSFRAGIQEVTLRIGSEQFSLSSYQGSLQFDTAKVSLLNVVLPGGDFHLVNRQEAENGTVRFAGFAVDGFPTAIEVGLSFETLAPMRSGDVQFELDVLGTNVGSKIRDEEVFEVQEMVPKDVR
jgi:hypothetical protein